MTTKGVSLFVSCPCHRTVEALTAAALLRLVQVFPRGSVAIELPANESLVQRARNEAVARFLDSDKSHLLFIDSDVIFRPEDVAKLVASGKDLIGGLYPQKWIDWEHVAGRAISSTLLHPVLPQDMAASGIHFNVNTIPGKMTAEAGCLPVRALATGFLLIAREVLTTMIAKFPEREYMTDWHVTPETPNGLAKRWNLFDCFISNGKYLSEDYGFCYLAAKAGFQPYAHLGLSNLGHIGTYVFEGDVMRYLTAGA